MRTTSEKTGVDVPSALQDAVLRPQSAILGRGTGLVVPQEACPQKKGVDGADIPHRHGSAPGIESPAPLELWWDGGRLNRRHCL
jgi:hypothetical protein